jgi:hypothetical protein
MYGNEFKNKNNMDSGSAFTENNSQITRMSQLILDRIALLTLVDVLPVSLLHKSPHHFINQRQQHFVR